MLLLGRLWSLPASFWSKRCGLLPPRSVDFYWFFTLGNTIPPLSSPAVVYGVWSLSYFWDCIFFDPGWLFCSLPFGTRVSFNTLKF